MPRKRPITYDVSAVLWKDAAFKHDGHPGTHLVLTVGVIVDMDDESVTIASEQFKDDSPGDLTTIPRGVVCRIIRVGTVRLPEFA